MAEVQARIVGDEEELGQFETLDFFGGQRIGRKWGPVDVTPDQLTKLQGNRFVELRGKGVDPFDHDGDGKAGGSKPRSTKASDAQDATPEASAPDAKPDQSKH